MGHGKCQRREAFEKKFCTKKYFYASKIELPFYSADCFPKICIISTECYPKCESCKDVQHRKRKTAVSDDLGKRRGSDSSILIAHWMLAIAIFLYWSWTPSFFLSAFTLILGPKITNKKVFPPLAFTFLLWNGILIINFISPYHLLYKNYWFNFLVCGTTLAIPYDFLIFMIRLMNLLLFRGDWCPHEHHDKWPTFQKLL